MDVEYKCECDGAWRTISECVSQGPCGSECPDPHDPSRSRRERKKKDPVDSPPHYNQGDIECIDAIAAALGPNFKYYCQGNAMKYLWRHEYKGKPDEDLKKAQWYLSRMTSNS